MEEIKKIIFTVTNDISYDQRMARICNSLANAGFEVEIVGRKRKNSVPILSKNYEQKRLNCFSEKGKLFYIEFNIRLFFYLLFKRVNVISSIDLDTLLACSLVSEIRSTKLVFDAHEYFTEVPEVTGRKMVKRIWESVAKWCIPHVHAAYTVDESLAEIFTKTYDKKFEVIRNVPYLDHSGNMTHQTSNNKHQTSNTKQIILYQGALNEGRGLEQMIDAMQQVDAEFWIAGEGDLSDQLRRSVEKKNLSYKINFLGFIPPDELKILTAKAYIGINILQNKGLSYYYSLSNKFFDYIHAGVPQVCAPFPEYEKLNSLYPVALLCECDVQQIVISLNMLLHDVSLYEKLQSECVKAKEIFNWENEEKKLLTIYTDVCK